MTGPLRIAVVQPHSTADPAANLALIRAALPDTAGADLTLFPEATMASLAVLSKDAAEPLDGPFAQGVRTLAAEFATTIAVGMFAIAADGRPRNTLFVTGPTLEATYDKLHLYDAWGYAESDQLAPGKGPVLIELAGLKLGLAICFDLRFPELFKHYARAGADAVLVAASWENGAGQVDRWRLLNQARAVDATVYVISSAQAEPRGSGCPVLPGPVGMGHSMAVAPGGSILHEAAAGPCSFTVELDPDAVASVRARLPVLALSRLTSKLG